jgi:hypothetical protein
MSQSAGALAKFSRRSGMDVLLGGMYEIKMATFLFARDLHKTDEFHLASNVDGAGAFHDFVFRYGLREPDVWKSCFIQLKHKISERTTQHSRLTQMFGDFSLFKHFESYCKIKRKYSTGSTLKHFGLYDDFELIIYTNITIESNSAFQGGWNSPLI